MNITKLSIMKNLNSFINKRISFILLMFLSLQITGYAQDHANENNSKKPEDKPDEYEIIINYTDGTSETLRSEFYSDEVTGKPFIFKNNCERIYADQTKTIILKNYQNDIEKAISYDNSWFFEVEGLTGPKINVYNDRPYKQNVMNYYFRKNDGEMTKYSKKLIKSLFIDHAEANGYAKKHLRSKSMQKIVLYSGLVIAVPGFIAAFSIPAVGEIVPGLVFLIGGATISSCNYLYNNKINRNLYKAVMVYNQQW